MRHKSVTFDLQHQAMRKKPRRQSWKRNLIAAFALLAAGKGLCADSTNSLSGNDALLDLFVKKGYVTQDEANQVKAEAAQQTNNPSALSEKAPAWSLVPGIKNMELFGDVRLRYEGRTAEDPHGGKIELNRLRFAVRIGLRGDAFDGFYYGVRLETAANPRSPWVTIGSSTSGSPYQGPFGKSTFGINFGQAYLGWHWDDYVNITAGKMPNYLYTTPMIWDNDLNPEGFFERFKYTVGQVDLFATFGQFVYEDTNPTDTAGGYFNPVTTTSSSLPFLLAWQLGFNYHVTQKVNIKAAPVLYQYEDIHTQMPGNNGGVGPDFDGTFVGQGQVVGINGVPASYNLATTGQPGFDGFFANQTGVNDLLIIDVPFELNVKMDTLDLRFFGDYAYNLHGSARATAAYNASKSSYFTTGLGGPNLIDPIPSAQTSNVKAYQFGIGIGTDGIDYGPEQGLVYGTQSLKHGWEFRTYWQHVEQYALDPNLMDSDFFEGRGNLEGIYAAMTYALSDNVLATVRYGHASRINNNLGTGGSNQDIPQMNPINKYSIVQVDASLRF
jgi:hypothetical protein